MVPLALWTLPDQEKGYDTCGSTASLYFLAAIGLFR